MSTYLYCMLAVLLIGLVCLVVIRRTHRAEESEPAALSVKRLELESTALKRIRKGKLEYRSHGQILWEKRNDALRLKRELVSVRTPWGWPQAPADTGNRSAGLSDAMQSLTNRLLREKKLLDRSATSPRASASLRALIEDRHTPFNWNSPHEIEYRKVKAPLLRDPNAPPDQMDNFGGKQAEAMRKKLHRVVVMSTTAAVAAKQAELRYVNLKDVKQPWGW